MLRSSIWYTTSLLPSRDRRWSADSTEGLARTTDSESPEEIPNENLSIAARVATTDAGRVDPVVAVADEWRIVECRPNWRETCKRSA
jgi:hypothetical protein